MFTRTFGAIILAAAMLGQAVAADFSQPERDPKFIQSARRQDKELVHFYGRLIPAGTTFNHLGSYQVIVHRNGLDRPATLVPVSSLPFADAEALRSAARTSDVVVGALKITYGMLDPQIMPGTLLLVFDGMRVHLRNVHGEDVSSFEASLGAVPAGDKLQPVTGAVNSDNASLAVITPDCNLRLYLQLGSGKSKGTARSTQSNKVLLSFSVPGLVLDDDSAPLNLAKPKDAKTSPAKVRQ